MNKSMLQNVVLLLAVFVVAVAGVWLGMASRTSQSAPIEVEEEFHSKLTEGTIFPDLTLVDEAGDLVQTSSLIGEQGTVVLFMELGCPPCEIVCERWQGMLDDSATGGMKVIGISTSPPRHVIGYKVEQGLRFPVYSDTTYQFVKTYEVTNFPMVVALDETGMIKWHTYDAQAEISIGELTAALDK